MHTLGTRIVSLRQNKNLTQLQLAQQVGVTKAMLSKYENDINIPKADILGKIADVLNTTSDFLLGRTNSSCPNKQDDSWMQATREEQAFLAEFRALTPNHQARVRERTLVLLEEQRLKAPVNLPSAGRLGRKSPNHTGR